MSFKIDFATVVYNDEDTLNLLKVQAHSMKFVEPSFINNIYIIYNDSGEYDFDEVISFYPEEVRDRVSALYVDSDFDTIYTYGWGTQQLIKILMAEKVTSEHYLALDAKDHFFKPIDHSTFFEFGNYPKLFLGWAGEMIKYYHGALKTLDTEDPFGITPEWSYRPLATTPYLFTTKTTLDLIAYAKENDLNFNEIFQRRKRPLPFTEFYLTTAYLIYSGEIKNYSLEKFIKLSLVHNRDSFFNRIAGNRFKILSIHKKIRFPEYQDQEFKTKALDLYRSCYDEKTVEIISTLF